VVLGVSGVALFANERFSIAGEALTAWAAGLTGGAAGLMRLHVLWGVAWALTVVPAFLLFKRGGFEALRELRPTRDDLVWLWRKPLVMVGLSRAGLPPQDKYNAGQKLFAAAVLGLVSVVIASGAAIALHLGPPEAVSAAIVAHGLAVGLLLAGLGVHFTMAAVISEERPALWSMLTGSISRSHAESHYARWAAEVLARQGPRAPGTEEAPPA
jgi:cytochrome b subunit of formate dehydrogenase